MPGAAGWAAAALPSGGLIDSYHRRQGFVPAHHCKPLIRTMAQIMPPIFVGRRTQQDCFIQWVGTEHGEDYSDFKRAALLVGSRGIGKSALLQRFERLCIDHAPATWYVQHLIVNANETPSAFLDRVLRELYVLFKRQYVSRGPNDHRLLKDLLSASSSLIPGGAPIGKLIGSLISPEDHRPGYVRFIDYLDALNSALTTEGRLVLLIDPVREMHAAQVEEWFSVVGQVPDNVRIVMAQRPTDPIVSDPEWRRHFTSLTGGEPLGDLSADDVTELYAIAIAHGPLAQAASSWDAAVRTNLPKVALSKYGGHPFAHNALMILLSQIADDEDPLDTIGSYPPKLAEELVGPLYEALRRQESPRRTLLLLLQIFRGAVPKSTWATAAKLDVAELDTHIASPEFAQYIDEQQNAVLGPLYTLFHTIFADRMEQVLFEEPAFRDELARQSLKALPMNMGGTVLDNDRVITDFDLIAAPIVASRLIDTRMFLSIVGPVADKKVELGLIDWAIMDHMLVIERQIDGARTCDAHANCGALHYRRGRIGMAESHYHADLKLARELGDVARIAHALGDIANIAHAKRQFSDAVVHLEEALLLHRQLNDNSGTAHTLGTLGRVHFSLKSYDRAKAYADEALTLYAQEGDSAGMMGAHFHMANALLAKGVTRPARSHLLKALRIARADDNSFYRSFCYGSLGNVEVQGGRPRRAFVLYMASLQIATYYGYPETGGAALLNLGHLSVSSRDLANALSYYESAKIAFQEAERADQVANVDQAIEALRRSQKEEPTNSHNDPPKRA